MLHNPAAQRFFDARSGHINIINEIDGRLLRITVPRDDFTIISVGLIRPSMFVNKVNAEDFIQMP